MKKRIVGNENGFGIVSILVVVVILGLIAWLVVPNLGLIAKDRAAQANAKAYVQLGELKGYENRARVALGESEEEFAKIGSVLKRGKNALVKADGGMIVIGDRQYTSEAVTDSLDKKMNRAETLQATIENQTSHLTMLEDGYRANVETIKKAKSELRTARGELQNKVALLASDEELQKVKNLLSGFDVRTSLASSNYSAAQKELDRRMARIEAGVEYGKLNSEVNADEVDWEEKVVPKNVIGRINEFLGEETVEVEDIEAPSGFVKSEG